MGGLVGGSLELQQAGVRGPHPLAANVHGDAWRGRGPRELCAPAPAVLRFQEEHPGFDFSGAEFSGSAPDPRKFMGGVPHI